jgi:hypothetical protein
MQHPPTGGCAAGLPPNSIVRSPPPVSPTSLARARQHRHDLRWDFDPTAAAVSSVSIVMTLLAVLLIDRTVGLRSLRFG